MQEQNELKQMSSDELVWDRPYYTIAGRPFTPYVAEDPILPLKTPYNAVTIRLDGGLKADLSWKKAREEAQEAVSFGYALFWDINLGLFDQLPFPLANQTQYLSLSLSLEHFRDSFWKDFKDQTIGLSLYRGSVDFSRGFDWNEQQMANLRKWLENIFEKESQLEKEAGLEVSSFASLELNDLLQSKEGQQLVRLFCRDVAMEYAALLAARLPDTLPVYLFLDATPFASQLVWQAQLLHPERYEHLNLAIKGHTLPFQAWGWETLSGEFGYSGKETFSISSRKQKEVKIGVCIPSMTLCRPSQFEKLELALGQLLQASLSFRLIAENHLITDWDGLDYLIFTPAGLSVQGKRKLQGFCAAGGTVVSTTQLLGLAYELSFEDFMQEIKGKDFY